MKILKFSEPLPDLILSEKKYITWRLNDDKNIALGDILSLCRNDGAEFAKAKVIVVKCTTFGYLCKEDKTGHEPFSCDKEMYETYSKYYHMNVIPDTQLKVIKFELL